MSTNKQERKRSKTSSRHRSSKEDEKKKSKGRKEDATDHLDMASFPENVYAKRSSKMSQFRLSMARDEDDRRLQQLLNEVSIILLMEETSDLSEFGVYLHRVISQGARKRFLGVSCDEIKMQLEKNNGITPESPNYLKAVARTTIEKIMSIHSIISNEAALSLDKKIEMTGARSKDLFASQENLAAKILAATTLSDDSDALSNPSARKNGAKANSKVEENIEAPRLAKIRSIKMNKRGEVTLPKLEDPNKSSDDAPANTPDLIVLLQGFYDVNIIDELKNIGATIQAILLMTNEPLAKRNFSIMDIEDSIPGTFRPKNILPAYIDELNTAADNEDPVKTFWTKLAETINGADPYSYLHDIALINFSLPPISDGMETAERKGSYTLKVMDHVASRIYEMLMLTDWFEQYKKHSKVRSIVDQPQDCLSSDCDYSRLSVLLERIPAECATVGIYMKCIVEEVCKKISKCHQVAASNSNRDIDKNDEAPLAQPCSEEPRNMFEDCGDLGFYLGHSPNSIHKANKCGDEEIDKAVLIRGGDYVKMTTSHLPGNLAEGISVAQVCQDYVGIRDYLWERAPSYKEEMTNKLKANLNHFLQFLPQKKISYEDLVYVIPLLMSAGVEEQLKKKTKNLRFVKIKRSKAPDEFYDMVDGSMDSNEQEQLITLKQGHEYLLATEDAEYQFRIEPDSDGMVKIIQGEEAYELNKQVNEFDTLSKNGSPLELKTEKDAMANEAFGPDDEGTDEPTYTMLEKNVSEIFDSNSEVAQELNETDDKKQSYYDFSHQFEAFAPADFLNRDENWLKDASEHEIFRSILECPALLSVSDNAALNLEKWVDRFVLCKGLPSNTLEDGVIMGKLKDWKYAEELEPIQMIQMLYDASNQYLCMERIYCPFYDYLIFIFNNPIPSKLHSYYQFYKKLRTLPGLQHFMEYTLNEDGVLPFLLSLEKLKKMEVVKTLSVETLLRIIPSEQWLLVPSIKFGELKAQKKAIAEQEQQEILQQQKEAPAISVYEVDEETTKRKDSDIELSPKGKKKRNAKSLELNNKGKSIDDISEKKKKRKNSKSSNNRKDQVVKVESIPENEPAIPEIPVETAKSIEDIEDFDLPTVKTIPPNKLQPAISPTNINGEYDESTFEKFFCYDLGKRAIIAASDTYNLFPLDGTIIQYDVSTIEPQYRMIQLSVSKDGHKTFFYPYFIPEDLDLSETEYIICPNFHMVHENGTRFAFKDRRVTESNEYIMKRKQAQGHICFSYDRIRFINELEDSADEDMLTPTQGPNDERNAGVGSTTSINDDIVEGKQNRKSKVLKGDTASIKNSKPKQKKKRKSSKNPFSLSQGSIASDPAEKEENEEKRTTTPLNSTWFYDSSDNSDTDDNLLKRRNYPKLTNWDAAEKLISPMVHDFKISIPSGLLIEISDNNGPPLSRQVRQSYMTNGSNTPTSERCRYYLVNGTVVKFMVDGSVQILTSFGAVTNIQDLQAKITSTTQLEKQHLGSAVLKLFNGELLLPDGHYKKIVKGKKGSKTPLYVFTTGPLGNGELFKRRQDGVITLFRHDGSVITHYPDGTRFTSRIVEEEAYPKFNDWVFIGIKYMVEHPNYATVVFNNYSRNVHVRLPHKEWARVFSDGSIKISTKDDYCLDVNTKTAVLSFPPCGPSTSDNKIGNYVSVRLWHQASKSANSHKQDKSMSIGKEEVDKQESEGEMKFEKKRNIKRSTRDEGSLTTATRGGKISAELIMSSPTFNPLAEGIREGEKKMKTHPLSATKISESTRNLLDNRWSDSSQREETTQTSGRKLSEFRGAELSEFLSFNDETTLCRAIDSWGNRYSLEHNGRTEVDKSDKYRQSVCITADDLIKTLSDYCKLPQGYLSGILNSTSSAEFNSAFNYIKTNKNTVPFCGRNPQSKIFVTKRNMEGFQFIKSEDMERILLRAKACPQSYVTEDPIPNKEHMRHITVMEPVINSEGPRGDWGLSYREPVFRPPQATNKDVKVTKPEELRWFGYVLMKAHVHRPRFCPSPRAKFRNQRKKKELPSITPDVTSALESSQMAIEHVVGENSQDLNYFAVEAETKSNKKEKRPKKSKSLHEKPQKKGIPKKKRETKNNLKDKTTNIRESNASTFKNEDKDYSIDKEDMEAVDDREIGSLEIFESKNTIHGSISSKSADPKNKTKSIALQEPEIGEYPEDIHDVPGIYELEDSRDAKIRPQFHSDPCNRQRMFVIRNFYDIPCIDGELQHDIVVASASYAKSVKSLLETYECRSPSNLEGQLGKLRQYENKKNLIENHMSDMHLFEQDSGKSLRYYI